MVTVLLVLVLAGLLLWAIGQLPLDATIAKLIRVVVVIAATLYVIGAFTGRHVLGF